MLDNLRQDTRRLREIKTKSFPWYVLESLLFENGYQAVVLHRIAHAFRRRGVPVLGPLFHRISIWLTGVDISPGATLGPGLRISHGVGIVIGDRVRLGAGALIMQGVTLGAPSQSRIDDMPDVGDRAVLGANCAVIGKVKLGDDVKVGVGCVVLRDLPSGTRVLPPEPRVLEPRPS